MCVVVPLWFWQLMKEAYGHITCELKRMELDILRSVFLFGALHDTYELRKGSQHLFDSKRMANDL